MEAQALFVYGTLRPDDDSGATWTHDFLKGLRSQKAVLRNAQLCFDVYPCAVLGVSGKADGTVTVFDRFNCVNYGAEMNCKII